MTIVKPDETRRESIDMKHPAADLLVAIAEGKQMEILDRWANWGKVNTANAALIHGLQHGWHTVRIARPMVTRTVTYPEPLRVKPENGAVYWYITAAYRPAKIFWVDSNIDHSILNAGMAFATEQDAAEAHKALFGAQT